jgi:hypothetical protein
MRHIRRCARLAREASGCNPARVTDHAPSTASEDDRLGREAAEHLVHSWPEVGDLREAETLEFAAAAVGRLAELIAEQPALFQASRRGSERGAESLSARPFQGIVESIQNSDDQGASELRVALRLKQRRRELLIVHDGAPISLVHVGAMVMPWVSTKIDDPLASGRFGIGQNTLRALGGPIDAHCHPYHFRMDEVPVVCPPEPEIAGFYNPGDRETLLSVPLDADVDTTALEPFMVDLGTRALVFLRSIRRVALIDLKTGVAIVDHQLRERGHRTVDMQMHGHELEAHVVELSDPARRQTYMRYIVEVPLKSDERRHNKATGPTTTLGVCVPRQPERGLLYDRLPLPVASRLPVGLNAQFDPDTARSTLHEKAWNAHRFVELGDLLAGAALDLFGRDAPRAWGAVPLLNDVPDTTSEWLQERYAIDVIGRCHLRLADELRLGEGDDQCALDGIVFEDADLESVLTASDQERLADGLSAVPLAQRDRLGRWRTVLQELGRSQMLDTKDALDLLDVDDADLGEREPTWYIAFAAAAIEADVFTEFCARRGVLLDAGSRISPPGRDEPRSLVIRDEPRSLGARLGLTLPIHPVYITGDRTTRLVRSKLEDEELLVDAYESDREALTLLARGRRERIRLEDEDLLSLRNSLEQLSEDQQRELGPKIGGAIELRGVQYDNGKAETIWTSPSTSYLPKQIDRETDSFARVAGKTPGLQWLAHDYARVLKRAGGRRELGAQRLLVRLGTQAFPRLISPPNESQRYTRDPRLVSPVAGWNRPEVQATELRALAQRATHLIDDRWSPDLDAVIDHIQQERAGAGRKRRAAALLGLLARGWERHFAEHATAHAVWGFDGHWHDRGDVIATWLARAATEPWLPSATGALRSPVDLHLPSEQNKLTVGDKRSLYLMSVDDQVVRSSALSALRIRRGPSATSIVSRLEELRDAGKTGASIDEQARTAYRILALACPPDGRGQRPVDDMTVGTLRSRFAGGRVARGNRGLLLVNGRWYTPSQVFCGPPIFRRRRPFVSASSPLEPLWRTLLIELPDARDCVAVLREIAAAPLADGDRLIVMETMRALAHGLEGTTPQLRATLKTLPVWTGDEWTTRRPTYAIADEGVAAAVAGQARVWQPGFAIDEMESLIEALGLTLIGAEHFRPVANAGYGAAAGEEFRPRFARAVAHLRTELARSDQQLYETLSAPWDDLAAARLVIDLDLEVAAGIPGGRRLVAPTLAHLHRQPLTLFTRSPEDAGSAEGGGRAIAELFIGDRQKVAWAWAAMWQKAEVDLGAQKIILSSDIAEADSEDDRLAQLQTQTESRRTREGKAAKRATGAGIAKGAGTVQVRQLKEIDKLEPSHGAIVNPGAPRGGIIVPPPRKKSAPGPDAGLAPDTSSPTPGDGAGGDASQDGTSVPLSVLPPVSAREQLAYDAVMAALALDEGEVADLRQRRGVGADASDELDQSFEIKMSSGSEIPAEITLTPNEVERARTDPDFFLAVVAGLEEGAGELRVRFIFDPLSRLPLRLHNDLTLGGVRDAEALEYVFPSSAADGGTVLDPLPD